MRSPNFGSLLADANRVESTGRIVIAVDHHGTARVERSLKVMPLLQSLRVQPKRLIAVAAVEQYAKDIAGDRRDDPAERRGTPAVRNGIAGQFAFTSAPAAYVSGWIHAAVRVFTSLVDAMAEPTPVALAATVTVAVS